MTKRERTKEREKERERVRKSNIYTFRDYRIAESYDVYSFSKKCIRHGRCFGCIIYHDWCDGVFCSRQGKTCFCHLTPDGIIYTMCIVHCTIYSVQWILDDIHGIMYILYIVNSIMHNVYCILNNVQVAGTLYVEIYII